MLTSALISAALLSACGGGGGHADAPSSQATLAQTETTTIAAVQPLDTSADMALTGADVSAEAVQSSSAADQSAVMATLDEAAQSQIAAVPTNPDPAVIATWQAAKDGQFPANSSAFDVGNTANIQPVTYVAAAPALSEALSEAAPTTRIAAATASTDTLATKALLGTAAAMSDLGFAGNNLTATTNGIGPTPQCKRGYSMPASMVSSTAAPLPASGGVFYSAAELAVWRKRMSSGQFVFPNDYTKGSPGDLFRIMSNASSMLASGETVITSSMEEAKYGTQGTLARDAAFFYLLTGDTGMQSAVRKYLIAQTSNPVLDFGKTLCITDMAGNTGDGKFFQASWLLRYLVTYDYVRSSLAAADRLTIENFIRRNAYFFAGHSDWGLANVFPNRMQGDYSKRASAAAATTEANMWATKRYDTNGDCKVNGSDLANALPVYAYVAADGKVGPRISVLSLYYNNRRSVLSTAYGAAGILLADASLIGSAKRYVMEWLAYGVWADGSQGEYSRNGDYCIASQGPIYAASNTQGAAMLASVLARQGDMSLLNFSTTDGLFGTQSNGGSPKSIELTIKTQLGLVTGQVKWFYHEPWRTTQNLTSTGFIGNTEVRYMASSKAMDDFHELGLLQVDSLLPKLNIASVVMRNKAVTSLRFPGSTGNPVPTGYGTWTDVFNALPAAFLLRP